MQKKLPTKQGHVCLGFITGAHGIKGEVKLKSFTAVPTDIGAYGTLVTEDGRSFILSRVRTGAKESVLAVVEGVTDRNVAENLRGTALFAPREALPEPTEEELLYADLPGLTAQYPDGTVLGVVVNVFDNGAHDVLEIKPSQGKLVLVPFAEEYVTALDLTARTLTLTSAAAELAML